LEYAEGFDGLITYCFKHFQCPLRSVTAGICRCGSSW